MYEHNFTYVTRYIPITLLFTKLKAYFYGNIMWDREKYDISNWWRPLKIILQFYCNVADRISENRYSNT